MGPGQNASAKSFALVGNSLAMARSKLAGEPTAKEVEANEERASTEKKDTDLVTQYKLEIKELETQLDNLSLTQTKKSAVKNLLAMTRSKLVREERSLLSLS